MPYSPMQLIFALGALPGLAVAQANLPVPAITQLNVRTSAGVADLQCEARPAAARPARTPDDDPMEIPTDDLIETVPPLVPLDNPPSTDKAQRASQWRPLASTGGVRIAIWGDSHLAANFFTEQLARLLKYPTESTQDVLLPANMGRAGVRLPLRKSCVSAQWKYEPGYVNSDNAVAPGPGLMNMSTSQAGAAIAWDVRTGAAARGYERVRVLYQQTEAPVRVAVSVDGQEEQEVSLAGAAGPGILELRAEQPISQLRVRLVEGALRLHGVDLHSPQSNGYALDVFGYPGATVAAWKSASLPYLKSWFAQREYQLVALEFGTNEGNGKPFDPLAYRKLLSESVGNFRSVFPNTACVLIAPGDRGVLVRRSSNIRKKSGGAHGKARLVKADARRKSAPKVDLFEYARIHAAIGRIQGEVAFEAGCQVWSMQTAMGGPGSAYAWAHQSPPLMAPDLIHFTVAGYQRLAQLFARDMGWTSAP